MKEHIHLNNQYEMDLDPPLFTVNVVKG